MCRERAQSRPAAEAQPPQIHGKCAREGKKNAPTGLGHMGGRETGGPEVGRLTWRLTDPKCDWLPCRAPRPGVGVNILPRRRALGVPDCVGPR